MSGKAVYFGGSGNKQTKQFYGEIGFQQKMFFIFIFSFKEKFLEKVSKYQQYWSFTCSLQNTNICQDANYQKALLNSSLCDTLNGAEILNACRFHSNQRLKTLELANHTFYNGFSGLRLQMPPDRVSAAVILEVILLFLRTCYMK